MAVATENPLLEGLRLHRTPEPCVVVIFGASGDLTRRKIMPALYSLAFRRLLHPMWRPSAATGTIFDSSSSQVLAEPLLLSSLR